MTDLIAELRAAERYLKSRMEYFDAVNVVNDRAQYVLLPSYLSRAADEIERLTEQLNRMHAAHPEKSCYHVPVFHERNRLRAGIAEFIRDFQAGTPSAFEVYAKLKALAGGEK